MSASSQIPRYEGPLLEGWEAAVHNSQVDHVDQETILTLSATVRQQPATWGLHSVSLCKPGASNYVLDERDRLRTFSYVVNAGINYAHVSVKGRALLGFCCGPRVRS